MNIYDARMFRQRGMSPLGILVLVILILMMLLIFNQGYILTSACGDSDDFIDCALTLLLEPDEETEAPQGSVTATGVISGEYGGEPRSVTVSMTFPLEGGAVGGNFSGDCDGTIKGTYAGGGGTISGTGKGSCAFVIPASGSFSGSVNTSSKTVPIHGNGSAAGFSGEGDLTLTY